jgi:hypothetical protein
MNHFKKVCRFCDAIIEQCRCPSKDKEIILGVCNNCKGKVKGPSSIDLADTTLTELYINEVVAICALLGYPGALVTDLSLIRDFAPEKETLNRLAKILGVKISLNDAIVDLAEKLKNTK